MTSEQQAKPAPADTDERRPMAPASALAKPQGSGGVRAQLGTLPGPPQRRETVAPAPRRPVVAAPEPADEAAPEKPATRSTERSTARRAKVSETADVPKTVGLSMPATLVDEVRAYAETHNISQADLLMDAILATRDRLPTLLAEGAPEPVRDDLFVRRAPRAAAEAKGILHLRMDEQNVKALDKLVVQVKAKSRSAMCAAAFRAHLDDQRSSGASEQKAG